MKISVCLASYNGEKYIQEQIQSILNCLSADDELIISDDRSTDNTVTIVNSFNSKKIKLFHNQEIKGLVGNFKNAVKHAKGDIIVLSDQDDVWLPNRLENLHLKHEEYRVVACNAEYVNAKLKSETVKIYDLIPPTKSIFKILYKNPFVGCTLSFSSSYKKYFLELPENGPMHDWVIGVLAIINNDVLFDDMVRVLFRRHGSNSSFTGVKSKRKILHKIKDRALLLKAVFKLTKL